MADANAPRTKPADHVNELKGLVVGYAKQETVDPLKSLGRYLGYGLGGGFLVGVGMVFLLMALLRGLQSAPWFDHNSGAASLVPYAATFVAAIIVIAVAGYLGFKNDPNKKKDAAS